MTTNLRRAGAVALVGSLALAAPVLGPAIPAPFVAVALVAVFFVEGGPTTLRRALPAGGGAALGRAAALSNRHERTFSRLAGFSLAAAGFGVLVRLSSLPVATFVASVLVVAYGTLGAQIAVRRRRTPLAGTVGFVLAGALAGVAGLVVVGALGTPVPTGPVIVFLSASGALLAGLVRSVVFARDEPLLLVPVGLLLWLFVALPLSISPVEITVALVVTVAFGALSYVLDAASITGMLTGILLALLTIVLGGVGWFVALIAFFGVGALAAKFRYNRKAQRGIAEADGGARSSGNVLANSAVALAAVLAYAASPLTGTTMWIFLYVFAGSLAGAMADTLSSELGGLFDTPRLLTTFEPVPPGTDGGVTWQGVLAGIVGAGLIAVIAVALFGEILLVGGLVILVGGVAGMFVDSLLGATIENRWLGGLVPGTRPEPDSPTASSTEADALTASSTEADATGIKVGNRTVRIKVGNRTVNFFATLAAAAICAALALVVGLAPT